MTAFNVVRFKVSPGMEGAFLDAHRALGALGQDYATPTLSMPVTGDTAWWPSGKMQKQLGLRVLR